MIVSRGTADVISLRLRLFLCSVVLRGNIGIPAPLPCPALHPCPAPAREGEVRRPSSADVVLASPVGQAFGQVGSLRRSSPLPGERSVQPRPAPSPRRPFYLPSRSAPSIYEALAAPTPGH